MGTTREEFDRARSTIPSMARMDESQAGALFVQFQEVERELGADPVDFFRYRLFERTKAEAAAYLVHRRYAELCGRINDPVVASGFFDRINFYEGYAAYLGREWVVGVPESRAAFSELCEQHRKLAYKTRYATYGSDFAIVSSRERTYLWRDALAERAVVEELIVQHELLHELFAGSVNCVRVLSVVGPDGTPSLLSAVLRCGRGRMVTDKKSGLFAPIDLAGGALTAVATSHQLERFERHPDTDVAFEGFRVPEWESLRERALEVAALHPELRLMNWDWACRADGVWCLVEGNFADGIGPLQEAEGRGLKPDIYAALGLAL